MPHSKPPLQHGDAQVKSLNSASDAAYDVLIIGAGFAGLHMLHQVRAMGLTARVFEAANDVGGVWYWNRYPGARCDVESLQYSYSFSTELEQEWVWTEKYAAQPEILRYIMHVADRFDLRRDIDFNTRITAAIFDETQNRWQLETDTGAQASGRFCVMASGSLSATRLPDIPGLAKFTGKIYHAGAWPHEGVDFSGKRVGVIGTGSSGIQTIPALARQVENLVVFQRTANFSIPGWNEALKPEDQQQWKSVYREHRTRAREVGTLYEFSDKGAMQATEQERAQEYERRWNKGGVNFVHSFNDVMVDKRANDTISDFVRARIRNTVEDPVVAEMLCPHDHPLGTKRICVDTGYYETYNRTNVKLVDLKKTPITEVSAEGVRCGDTEYALDALVCATGYDALTGALLNMDIRGRNGLTLVDKWADGPCTYLGLMTAGFPNMFIITGAGSPSALVNMVVGIEQHVEWISDCITYLDREKITTIEAGVPAEKDWVEHVNKAANKTLFPLANSWFLGANIPGKPRVFMPYVARIGVYRKECDEIADNAYRGFILTAA
ncbi:NAD(P)/FAD-dependent oxidoreductase [Glaciimonas sp. Gout2]|uniref:flavin-containing monooxygenase n=2 Tax=Glaciimonas TaxID=1229970 RepID=UPI002B230C8B|nr:MULTISPECIES: NAD(P)/FAD-dependent oxidoreductase [unclassified Glaciimonas]MEB0013845.1 NAD(P)/FAD-dependent oxidoreductase [Glaciimonas sp. Cout2]MEB0083052.1 NAD(P)/FAD-dependent oxidoreductase [Glaciimonas sp. Gout2]